MVVLCLIAALAQAPPVNPTGAAVLAFRQRVAEYIRIHDDAQAKVPNLKQTDDPALVSGREAALGSMIRSLRPEAREGDIFGPDFRKVLEKEVRDDFRSRSKADRKALVEELPPHVKLAVNMTYPAGMPLATFPAKLLARLPPLPPNLEYRIVGRHLVLRDVKANIIADIARDIVPTIPS